MAQKVRLSDAEQTALHACVTQLERDDQFIRERNIRQWKKAEEYWRLNQFIYWSEIALDYRSITTFHDGSQEDDDNDTLAPKTFPIYRAYGESIIAAMAAVVPTVLFFPDDANNPDDITAAKAYSLISELIQRHSKAPLLIIRILTLLYNQGLCATYCSWDDDKKHGSVKLPKYRNEKVKMQEYICPKCEHPLASKPIADLSDNEDAFKDELTKGEQSDLLEEKPLEQEYLCENCGYQGPADLGDVFEETIPRLVGYSDTPKGRISIEAFGPLNVRLSTYAKKQSDIGLLELQIEMHYAAARHEFPDIADKIQPSSDFYSYERWGRTSSELLSDQLYNQTTIRYCWVREWGFEAYSTSYSDSAKDLIRSLKEKFPHGCCVVFVNDTFAEVWDESMDDHWSISENPLDAFIHGIPLGKSALDVQDAYNEVKNLQIQKNNFGIQETFVDGTVIDEDAYRQQMSGPGYLTFATAPAGRSMQDAFFQTRTASMNEEDLELSNSLNTDAQFFTGSVPSIFGGAQVGGSRTATEYNQSRNFALQRLGNHWTNLKYLWSDTMSKGARLFATNLLEDEKFVRKNGNSFETVWIRKAQLTGKIGNVEPDPSEQFPITWSQKRDLFMQLITLQNPIVGQIMLHPNNAQNTKDALGFPEFYIPGEADRTKQLIELRKLALVDSETFPPNSTESTVAIDPDVDDDKTHIEVIKLFAVSPEGLYLQETNPAAYLNMILHLKAHEQHLNPAPPQVAQQPKMRAIAGNRQ